MEATLTQMQAMTKSAGITINSERFEYLPGEYDTEHTLTGDETVICAMLAELTGSDAATIQAHGSAHSQDLTAHAGDECWSVVFI